METSRFYDFGAFRLDRTERRLFRDGSAIALAPKSMDVLLVFVENAGRVLGRADLISRVWPDSEGAEGSLAVTISALRKALGDRPDGGLYIETAPRQGYRFAATVTAGRDLEIESAASGLDVGSSVGDLTGEGATPSAVVSVDAGVDEDEANAGSAFARPDDGRSSVGWFEEHRKTVIVCVVVALGAAAVVYALAAWRSEQKRVPVRRLAILPFRNLKPDAQTDFLGPSLADATTTMLRGFSSLIVRPSSYVEKYRGQDVDAKKAADDLNVDTLMTGTFLKEGDTLRVTVQLIDVTRGEIVSKLPFETRYEKLVTVQDRVARNIIDRLQLNLSPSEAEQLRQQTSVNPLAYEYFLRGTDAYSRNDFLAAMPLLEKAVELDPNFAAAWAHLGRAYTASASFNLMGRGLQLKAQSSYEQALALNPGLIEATVFTANLFTDSNRVEQAVPLLRKLLASNPNIAEARWELGYAYRFAGMLEESIAELERARAIDPNVKRGSSAPNSYLYKGQYEKFLASLPKDEGAAFLVFYRGMGNYYLKRFDEAAVDFDRAYELEQQLYTRTGKALSYAIRNQKAIALEVIRDVEREIEQKNVGDAEAIYKVAQVYSVLGEKAAALRVFQRSIESGFFCYDYFKADPLLDGIRNESDFNRVLEIARQRHERLVTAFF